MSESQVSGWRHEPVSTYVKDWAVGPRFPGELYAPQGNVATLRTTDMDNEGNIDLQTMPRAQLPVAAFRSHFLEPHDLVISRSGTIGITGVFEGHVLPVVPGAFLIRFRFDDEIEPRFVRFLWNSPAGRQRILKEAEGGVQKNIRGSSVLRIQFEFPPRPEQSKIARILTTLDNLIEKTEALIAKYQSIKQGMMHDLFTRGVDSHGHLRPTPDQAPELYKPSELGLIPKDWEPSTVGNELLAIDAGKSPNCPDQPAPDGEWGVLKVSAVQPDGFRPNENKIIADRIHINPAYEVKSGDLLLSRSNTYQLVGIVSLVGDTRTRLMLCDKTLRLRFNQSEARTEFMFWQLQQPAVRRQIEIHATGTSGSMKNISQPSIRGLKFAKPPVEEQKVIAARILAVQKRIRSETMQNDKLRKQKSGLMQDLLTGKVRVNTLHESTVES